MLPTTLILLYLEQVLQLSEMAKLLWNMYMDLVSVNISMIDKIHYNLMMYKYYSEFITTLGSLALPHHGAGGYRQ